jgi:putative endonuclease
LKKDTTTYNKQTERQGLGRTGERLAAEALMSNGYHILERNFRCHHGEIDLIAEDEQDLIFVEVKARRGVSFGLPEDAITIYKRRKLVQLASYYLDLHSCSEYPQIDKIMGGKSWQIS